MAIFLADENQFDSQFVKRSYEALTDDLLFLFDRLNVRVSFAVVFIEGHVPVVPRDLLRKTCESLPIHFSEYTIPHNIHLAEALALINSLNLTRDINGLIINLPPSPDFMLKQLFNSIDPLKNVWLNDSDYLKLKQLTLDPYEIDILSILMILEKTFNSAVEQVSKQRGNL
ncbi:MAG: tetrahydrofolate dehydrogenase/cyclohydrolase catalytic domain-containing protein [Desulfitobacteriaceae bacterium]